MSNSIFITALGISIIYALLKFVEMRFIIKENKPFKVIFRDTIFVYLSVVGGNFILDQMGTLGEIASSSTKAFTDNPDF